jgi:hypothetical protein
MNVSSLGREIIWSKHKYHHHLSLRSECKLIYVRFDDKADLIPFFLDTETNPDSSS